MCKKDSIIMISFSWPILYSYFVTFNTVLTHIKSDIFDNSLHHKSGHWTEHILWEQKCVSAFFKDTLAYNSFALFPQIKLTVFLFCLCLSSGLLLNQAHTVTSPLGTVIQLNLGLLSCFTNSIQINWMSFTSRKWIFVELKELTDTADSYF